MERNYIKGFGRLPKGKPFGGPIGGLPKIEETSTGPDFSRFSFMGNRNKGLLESQHSPPGHPSGPTT